MSDSTTQSSGQDVTPPAPADVPMNVRSIALTVIAIATRPTPFPTIQIPKHALQPYVNMCAGWNVLVEVGIKLGNDLDKPVRARKVGNEFVG